MYRNEENNAIVQTTSTKASTAIDNASFFLMRNTFFLCMNTAIRGKNIAAIKNRTVNAAIGEISSINSFIKTEGNAKQNDARIVRNNAVCICLSLFISLI